jgi:phosphopantetheinyl transferase (holo-ACP synthase)
MNNSPNRKAPGSCNTEGLGTTLYKSNFAIHEAHSKAISTHPSADTLLDATNAANKAVGGMFLPFVANPSAPQISVGV